jgi:hypothetical protein
LLVGAFGGVVTGGVTGAVAFTGGTFVTVQSAFKVAQLGVVVQTGGVATGAVGVGAVVGAGVIGVIAGATHATGAFAIGACCAFTCDTASATERLGFAFLSSRACLYCRLAIIIVF